MWFITNASLSKVYIYSHQYRKLQKCILAVSSQESEIMHRLFIAVDFPDEVNEALSNICFGMQGATWVHKNQIHLTVRFIGDADDTTLSDLIDVLDDVNNSTFQLSLHGVGFFPPRKKPNVLWVGIDKSQPILDLRYSIEKCLSELGIHGEERKYHPHVTLARLRQEARLDHVMQFLSLHSLFKIHDIAISEFHLYSSILTPDGAIHTKEASFSLL